MNIHDLLSRCVQSGVKLARAGGELRVHFDGELRDTRLLSDLRAHKQDVLRHLESTRSAESSGIRVSTPGDRSAGPVSPAQRRMWLLDRMSEGSGSYNMLGFYRLSGVVDTRALREALDSIVCRHESLRTSFVENDGILIQVVNAPIAAAFEIVDLCGLHEGGHRQALDDLLQRENRWHFDLSGGVLLRATCVKLGDMSWFLLLNVHHIACDGWSVDILEREIADSYAKATSGLTAALPRPVQYLDYVDWSERIGGYTPNARQLDYWKTALEGAPAVHGLPLDRPRPAIQAHAGSTIRRNMSASWLASVERYCNAHGMTLFMYMHAALVTVLGVYSNERDVVIGFPSAGRRHRDLDATVGLFVNTLLLRTRIVDGWSFAEILEASKLAVIAALDHQDVPYDALVDELRPERSLAYTPLSQILLSVRSGGESGLRLDGVNVEMLDNPDAPVKFDLQVEVTRSSEGLTVDWHFSQSLFDHSSMERMVDSLVRLLAVVDAKPEIQPFLAPIMVGDEEHTLLLDTWNRTALAYPDDRCVHQLFAERVRREPDAVALVCDERRMSYGELNREANRLAHHLVELGVRSDALVAVCIERSISMVVALLAIFKAGGAYVPLDPAAPLSRQIEILTDAQPLALLADTSGNEALCAEIADDFPIVDMDDYQSTGMDYPEGSPVLPGLTSRHLAYVIYTSGSTGTPKGVMVEHRSLCNLIAWHGRRFDVGPGKQSTSMAGLTFDACVWEIWPTLVHGGTLLLPPREWNRDANASLQWWRRQSLDSAFLVTPLAKIVMDGGASPQGLNELLIGGDRLISLPQGLGFRVINNYGPTEITVVATSGVLSDEDHVVHIGRPIANTRIYLLD
ncbi:MAG: condensation domain-containing protein, partial [Luteibacter sp.]